MSLLDYYKHEIYAFGYFMSERDRTFKTDHKDMSKDIFFNDEFDYSICASYYGRYVGSPEDWSDEDIEFLNVLGFYTSDFEEYMDD